MCGLTGVFATPDRGGTAVEERAQRMTATLAHRGPDDAGLWADPAAGVGLGFRRLAIVDLSAEGHQPMVSSTGRFVMVFNGEVYNHPDLRKRLHAKGLTFRGHSDTEVMLGAFEHWGVRRSVGEFIGMFAIAVWDRRDRELHLIRDRLGIKPLYYQCTRDGLLFGSELKALAADPAFDRTLDAGALAAYLRLLYVPSPRSIFAATHKLLPGHILTIRNPATPVLSTPYWTLDAAVQAGLANPHTGSEAEILEELEALLLDSVRLRMQADVPLGALLSGGLDSSTVVALMQTAAREPVRTYTIGFDVAEYNEAAHARDVASYLGTRHTELHLTGADAMAVVPQLPQMFDEPLADPSQIPTYLVSRLARQEVTVALSGDGGDELLGGYNRYILGERLIGRAVRWPVLGRRLAASALQRTPARILDGLGGLLGRVVPYSSNRLMGEKLRKLGDLLEGESAGEMYRSLLSAAWQDPARLMAVPAQEPPGTAIGNGLLGLLEAMMQSDQGSYLPDDLLAKVDRASMAVSLEVRVPLLDHRVVEYSWRLPRRFKVRHGEGKWALRQILYRHVPRALVDRPKMGFSVPIAAWLRGPLRPWAESHLRGESLASDGLFESGAVRSSWTRFLAGDDRDAIGLWAILQFQEWRAHWLPAGPAISPAEVPGWTA